MKAFVILFATVAAATAKAQYSYYPTTYTSPLVSAFQPAVYSGYHAPAAYAAVVPVAQGPKYVAKNGEVEHVVYKREAEAEAEAQFPFYGNVAYGAPAYTPYGVPAYTGYAGVPAVAYNAPVYGTGLKTYANDAVSAKGYAAKNQYVAETAGSLHIAKREAEAEPEAALAYGYATPYATAYNYGLNYGSAYARPLAYSAGYPYTAGYAATGYPVAYAY